MLSCCFIEFHEVNKAKLRGSANKKTHKNEFEENLGDDDIFYIQNVLLKGE